MRCCRNWIVALGCLGSLSIEFGCGRPAAVTPQPDKVGAAGGNTASTNKATSDTTAPNELSSGTAIEGPVGTIEGTVIFVGDDIRMPEIVTNTTDPLVCGAKISKRDVEISPENKGIRYVLVWLEDVKLPDGYKPPRQDLVLDNKNCQFEPHAAVTTVGSTIEATNSDDVFHTTNLYGATSENMPLVSKGSSQRTVARRPGTIPVKCDKHGWMQAFIRVDPHPFHAVTDADGKFSIANVPAGTYKLKSWHEVYYGQDTEVTAKPDDITTLEIKYPTERQK